MNNRITKVVLAVLTVDGAFGLECRHRGLPLGDSADSQGKKQEKIAVSYPNRM